MLALLLASLLVVPASVFEQPQATRCFDRLLVLGGNGHRQIERAAFLVYRDGNVDCVIWPASRMHRAERWEGAVPDGTIAIAHTHPNDRPELSEHDRELSRELGIPVFVVTRLGVRLP